MFPLFVLTKGVGGGAIFVISCLLPLQTKLLQ